MGEIAHLAGEYNLASDIFGLCANMFLRDGDTLNYYYALNETAFELAELGEREKTHDILSRINYPNHYLEEKKLETLAVLYLHIQQFDSAIYYSHKLYSIGNHEPTGLMICAQVFSIMGQKDSAVCYAKQVLSISNDLYHRNNSLYILTNDDINNEKETIRQTAADRSDVQKLLEIRRGKMSQAVQFLKQDLHRELNLTWLYSMCATLVIISMIIGVYVFKKHKKRDLLSQQVSDLEYKTEKRTEEMLKLIEEHCSILRSSLNLKEDLCWKDFDKMCAIIDKQFNMLSTKIRNMRVLNEKSFRLCILTLLDVDRKTISEMLPYALSSVGKLKDDTAKSLGTSGKNLRAFLLKLTLERIK